jgi:hypothetical protein
MIAIVRSPILELKRCYPLSKENKITAEEASEEWLNITKGKFQIAVRQNNAKLLEL